MSAALLTVEVRREPDVVAARQRARQVAVSGGLRLTSRRSRARFRPWGSLNLGFRQTRFVYSPSTLELNSLAASFGGGVAMPLTETFSLSAGSALHATFGPSLRSRPFWASFSAGVLMHL